MSCLVGCLDSCVPALKRCFDRVCPCLYRVFCGRAGECWQVKAIFGFAIGALLGAALYFSVIEKLDFREEERIVFGASVTLLLGVGFAFSIQIRCILLLVLPNFFGRHGRSVVSSIAIVLLLSGPVHNIVVNAKESSRAISCTSSLTFNHSKDLFNLLNKPFHDAFKDIWTQQKDVEGDIRRIHRYFAYFEDEIEGDVSNNNHKIKSNKKKPDEAINKMYKSKNLHRCEDIFVLAIEKCEKLFRDKEEACKKKIAIPLVKDVICLPLKLTILCQLTNLFSWICDDIPDPPEGLPAVYNTLLGGLHSLDNSLKVRLKWQITKFPDILNGTSVAEVRERLAYELRLRRQWMSAVASLAKVILSFAFLLVFKSASNYNSKYLKDNNFDNVYMTAYFRKIDARRRKSNKRTLLPQKKAEKNDIIETARWRLRREEKKSMMMGTVRLFMQVVLTVVLIFFDNLFYVTLDLIERHSQVSYRFKGQHKLHIKVKGEGAVAILFRRILASFNKHHSVDRLSTNKACLPHPHPPDHPQARTILGMWAGVWLLLYLQAYGLRLRRVICAYFYPKKEKQRVIFLYNEHLKKRKGFLKFLRLKVRRLAKEEKIADSIGTLTTLRRRYPRLCCWMGLFRLGRRKCLICTDTETKDFQTCPTRGCDFVYCQECWMDVKRTCYGCTVFKDADDGNDDSFLSEDD